MLAIFLSLGIATLVLTIKVINKVKKATDEAAQVAENIQQLTSSVSKMASGPMLIAMAQRAFDKLSRKKK